MSRDRRGSPYLTKDVSLSKGWRRLSSTFVSISADECTFWREWRLTDSKHWSRLLLSPFFHLDDWHIYYNMASFLWKGISLSREALWQWLLPLHGGRLQRTLQRRQLGHLLRLLGNLLVLKGMLVKCYLRSL